MLQIELIIIIAGAGKQQSQGTPTTSGWPLPLGEKACKSPQPREKGLAGQDKSR